MGDPNITAKCKECFNDIDKSDLIYPKRGYPYCKNCFDGCLSLVDKKKFEPCFKQDIPFIKKSIHNSKKTTADFMNGLKRRSNNFLKNKDGKLMDNYNLGEIIRSIMNSISNVKVGQSGKLILEISLLTKKIEGDKASKNNIAISEDNELVISHFKMHTDLTGIIENGNF